MTRANPWWSWSIGSSGRIEISGPHATVQDANSDGYMLFDGKFEVGQLGTSDPARAKDVLRRKYRLDGMSREQVSRIRKRTVSPGARP